MAITITTKDGKRVTLNSTDPKSVQECRALVAQAITATAK